MMSEEKINLKKRINSLEAQEYNVNKMLKVLQDPDFDTYTFTIEASREEESFKDKQVIKFYDFSTLPEALMKAMPAHLDTLHELIDEAKADLSDLEKKELEEVDESTE